MQIIGTAPPAGGGRSRDGSGGECRREGEAEARQRPGLRAASGPAGGAQSPAAQDRYSQAGEPKLPSWLHFR
ncbi:Hypothetical predicted protein [Marmota monax]|uniref:Uncharacterized protein n=1 Tax=Marmota monax TaxID=9995 RepID=A0A5E4A5Z5_MARMO|nr:hypothetical protein GHT09_002047 [Marmota monax]VTJ52667.1 Hypothetical predicted protein [Marmota monax]